MSEWLTESDWERITMFANASMHDRTPELLLPDDAGIDGRSPHWHSNDGSSEAD